MRKFKYTAQCAVTVEGDRSKPSPQQALYDHTVPARGTYHLCGESMLHRLLETGEVGQYNSWLNTDKLFSKFKLPTITSIDCPMTYVSPVPAGIHRRLVSRQMSRRSGDSNSQISKPTGKLG